MASSNPTSTDTAADSTQLAEYIPRILHRQQQTTTNTTSSHLSSSEMIQLIIVPSAAAPTSSTTHTKAPHKRVPPPASPSIEEFSDWSGVPTPTSSSAESDLSTLTITDEPTTTQQTFHIHRSLLTSLSPRLSDLISTTENNTLPLPASITSPGALPILSTYFYTKSLAGLTDPPTVDSLKLAAELHTLGGYLEIPTLYSDAYSAFTTHFVAVCDSDVDTSPLELLDVALTLHTNLNSLHPRPTTNRSLSLVSYLARFFATNNIPFRSHPRFLELVITKGGERFLGILLDAVVEATQVECSLRDTNPVTPCCGTRGGFGTFNLSCNVCGGKGWFGPDVGK